MRSDAYLMPILTLQVRGLCNAFNFQKLFFFIVLGMYESNVLRHKIVF